MRTFLQIWLFLLSITLIATGCTDISTNPGDKLEVVGKWDLQEDGYQWVITGALRNKSKKTLVMAGISIPICNNRNEKIADAADITSGLEAGQTWRFKAPVVASDWQICEGVSPTITAF